MHVLDVMCSLILIVVDDDDDDNNDDDDDVFVVISVVVVVIVVVVIIIVVVAVILRDVRRPFDRSFPDTRWQSTNCSAARVVYKKQPFNGAECLGRSDDSVTRTWRCK